MARAVPVDPQHLSLYAERIGKVRADSPRRWGKMTPTAMLAHLRRSFEISLSEVPVTDQGNFLTHNRLLRWLVLDLLPIPKGKIKGPAVFFPDAESDFEAERAELLAALGRFVETSVREPQRLGMSPLFGWVPLSQWARVHGKHMEHHLQQFGV